MNRSAVLAVLASLTALSCSEDAPPPATSPCADRQQVSLPDCAAGPDRFSDEACIALDDAIRGGRAMVSDARSASISAPTEMQAVPRATPFTFTWTAPTAARPRYRPMTVGDELRRWVTLIPEAEAHCLVFNGRAYELRFTVNNAVVYRRQQSALSWTPTAAEWARLTSAIGARAAELTVYTALYTTDQISQGSGPFYPSAPRRFTVAP